MTALQVVEFDHDSRVAREYLDLIGRVHADDPQWIAPLRSSTRAQLAPTHAFYRTPENRYRGFALRRGDRLVGHVLATVNKDLVDSGGKVGALGFLEVEPDYELFRTLLEPAISWLRSAADVRQIWATMNFDIWHSYRVMTRGFEEPAFFGEPRNGPWLPKYFEQLGFSVKKRWVSVTTSREFLIGRAPHFRPQFDSAIADGYVFERLHLKDAEELANLRRAVSISLEGFDGYTPTSRQEFEALVVAYLRLAGTELATVLRAPDGAFAGFNIALPDPSETLHKLAGRDDWLNRLRLLRRPPPHRALQYMIGVLPGVRAVRRGLGRALFYRTLQLILEGGYESIIFALLAEDSPARYFAMDQVKAAEREYALYQLGC
jgi:hypothetical protein